MHRNRVVEERIARALRQIARAVDMHSRDILQRYGLTGPQLATLLEIQRLQPVSTGTLASEIHLGSATLTGILDRLEERGLVCRTRDTADRRAVLLTLTESGRQLFASAPPQLCETFGTRLAELPEWEQTAILSMLQRIAGMMAPEGGSSSGVGTGSGFYAIPRELIEGSGADQSSPSVPSA